MAKFDVEEVIALEKQIDELRAEREKVSEKIVEAQARQKALSAQIRDLEDQLPPDKIRRAVSASVRMTVEPATFKLKA